MHDTSVSYLPPDEICECKEKVRINQKGLLYQQGFTLSS